MNNNNNLNWYLFNCKNKILGRLITRIIPLLMGKNKSNYLPYKDTGNFVILINVKKILVTGNKMNNKIYYRHSGYIGNLKSISFKEMLKKSPEYIIKKAVKGMLPKNYLGYCYLKRLKIYSFSNHLHISQKPVLINL